MAIQNDILEYHETDYLSLPIIFGAGNPVHLKLAGGAVHDLTRPIYYQAKGAQDLLNCAVQQLGTYIDTMAQAKMMVPIQSVPEEYLDLWKNVQTSQFLPYNPFCDERPDQVMPAPSAVPITPLPPEVMNTIKCAKVLSKQQWVLMTIIWQRYRAPLMPMLAPWNIR